MKFHRITKPLTALALCALLATAYNISVAPSFAADDKKVVADTKDKDSAKEKKAAKEDAKEAAKKEAAKKEEKKDEPADTAAATEVAPGEDESAAADDDIMPPMATASKTDIPADLPSPNDSKIAPDIKRMRTVDLGEAGSSDAFMPAEGMVGADGVPYVEPVGETHPTLNLTPDKSIIVRLDRPAASVLVGNDAHVNVMIDTPTTLVVIPRMPGASYFTVLDQERRILMKRHVIVGSAGQYVRVRRSCGSNSSSACQHTSTFYCPEGMCHPIETQQRPGSPPEQTQASTNGGGGGNIMGSTSSDGAETTTEGMPTMPSFPFIPIPFPIPGYGGEMPSDE